MKMQKQSFAIKKADVLPLCIMGLLFSFSSLFLFMSYNYMDAGIASTKKEGTLTELSQKYFGQHTAPEDDQFEKTPN